MNQIGLELLHNFGALHLGQIKGEGNVIVKGEGESLRVVNAEAELFGGELLLIGLAINGKDFDIIACLGKELEHLIKSIGVARHVRKRRRLDHEGNFARLVPTERRSIGIIPAARLASCGRSRGGIKLRGRPDRRCWCSSGPSRWPATNTRGEEGAGGGRRRGRITLDNGPAQHAGAGEDKRESFNANHLAHRFAGVSFRFSLGCEFGGNG